MTNEEVLRRAKTKRWIIQTIAKRQVSFFGHVMRKEKIEQLVTTGKIIGKRSRGRQLRKSTDQIKDWTMTFCNYDVFKRAREKSHGCRRLCTWHLEEEFPKIILEIERSCVKLVHLNDWTNEKLSIEFNQEEIERNYSEKTSKFRKTWHFFLQVFVQCYTKSQKFALL